MKNKFQIKFDEHGAIESLIYQNKQFIGKKVPLFHLRLRKRGESVDLYSTHAQKVEINEKKEGYDFHFSNFPDHNIKVYVHIALGENIQWNISLENNSEYIIEWVGFPELVVPDDLIGQKGKARVLYGSNEGLICENVREHRRIEPDYPSEGLMGLFPAIVETPFIAYYEKDGPSIYIGAHDSKGNLKTIDFQPWEDRFIKFNFRLHAAILPGASYVMPYNMVWQFFTGDWQDAAEIYRTWFKANLPKNFIKIEEDKTLPEWYKDSFVVLTYPIRGTYDTDIIVPNKLYPYKNALPHIERISKIIDSNLLVLLMQWEGTAPWAPPYVWPPFGGEEEFKSFIEEVHALGHAFGVYCSGTGFTIKSQLMDYDRAEQFEKDGLHKYMCLAPDGSLPYSHICTAQRTGYDMCISQDFTKEVLLKETLNIVEAGVDYIQILDQNHGGTPYFCYSEEHGHPPVPGIWQVNAMQEFLQELLQKTKDVSNRTVLFGCESAAAETYIPYLRLSDNRYNLNYFGDWPVPMYAYVYHEYVNNFSGNGVCAEWICDMKKSSEILMLRMAYSFIAGDLFTLVMNENGDIAWNWGVKDSNDLPNQDHVFTFVKNANKLRKLAKQYLCFGKMIKGPTLECETYKFYSYSYPQPLDIPVLLSSSWEDSDGTQVTVIANYMNKPNLFSIDVSYYDSAELFDEAGNKILETSGVLSTEIRPLTAYILKYKKSRM